MNDEQLKALVRDLWLFLAMTNRCAGCGDETTEKCEEHGPEHACLAERVKEALCD
jgi:hypothetical protein